MKRAPEGFLLVALRRSELMMLKVAYDHQFIRQHHENSRNAETLSKEKDFFVFSYFSPIPPHDHEANEITLFPLKTRNLTRNKIFCLLQWKALSPILGLLRYLSDSFPVEAPAIDLTLAEFWGIIRTEKYNTKAGEGGMMVNKDYSKSKAEGEQHASIPSG